MENNDELRNYRIYMVPMRELFAIFRANQFTLGMSITLTDWIGPPEDAEYAWAFYDPSRDCMMCIFRHPSFLPVKVGEQIPIADNMLAFRTYEEFKRVEREGTVTYEQVPKM